MSQTHQLTIESAISKAKKAFKQGKLEEAQQLYHAVLQKQPSHPVAKKALRKLEKTFSRNKVSNKSQVPQHQLDDLISLYESGSLTEAALSCEKLLRIYPQSIIVLNILGAVLKNCGKLQQAARTFEKIIQLNPGYAEAYNNRGVVFKALGRYKDALADYDKAILLNPKYAEAYGNQGVVYKELGQYEDALASFDKAIVLKPDYVESYNNRGNTLKELRRLEEAIKSYDEAIVLKSDFAVAYGNRAITLHLLGKAKEAIQSYNMAIQLQLDYAEAYSNRGLALKDVGLLEEALSSCAKAIMLNVDYAEAYCNLGVVLKDLGRLEEALVNYDKAIQLKHNYIEAYNNRGVALVEMGQYKEAISCYDSAIQLGKDFTEAYSNRYFALNYCSDIDQHYIFEEHLKFEKLLRRIIPADAKIHHSHKLKNTRLRIGYVSPDFNYHPVACFFEPLLKSHDKNAIEVYCYYNHTKFDNITKRLMNITEHWRYISGIGDKEVVELIKKDNIDILVDLTGHTANNRLPVFFYKPAPIQVSWLGYPNTTGLSSIDYRFTDEISDPIGTLDDLHSEKLLRLPDGFLCYQGDDSVQISDYLPCSRNGYITFGSFNNLSKVTSQVVRLWAKILKAVPDSHLLLKAKQLADASTRKRLLNLFEEEGVSHERIEFFSRLSAIEDHLNLYNSIDIALDPFPYNGTTTTCEALWMGVPVITMLGDRHSSRVSASILTRIGFSQFIGNSEKEYLELAIQFTNDTKILEGLRNSLRDKMKHSDLTNSRLFAKNIEKALNDMWIKYQSSLKK